MCTDLDSTALQLCETAPNSSKAVGRAAECHEYLSQCYLQAVCCLGFRAKWLLGLLLLVQAAL